MNGTYKFFNSENGERTIVVVDDTKTLHLAFLEALTILKPISVKSVYALNPAGQKIEQLESDKNPGTSEIKKTVKKTAQKQKKNEHKPRKSTKRSSK